MTHNLLTGCPECDQHGPDEYPPLTFSLNLNERRELHRAGHNFARTFLEPAADALARLLPAAKEPRP